MRHFGTLACLAAIFAVASQAIAQGVPGLIGDTGDDLTLDYLYGLETFESLPSWPRFYFSDDDGGLLPPGDDSGPCSEAAPCLSGARMNTLLAGQQVILVLDAGLWDDPADELAGFAGFEFDNSGCGAEAGSGANTMTDEPCAFIVPYDPEQPARFDCSALSGSVDLDYWLQTRGNGSGYLGVAGVVVESCPEDADGTGTEEWGIHVANRGGGNGNFVGINVVVGGLAGTHTHVFRTQGGSFDGGHMVLINSAASVRDFAEFNSSCTGPGCAANLCTGPATPYNCCKDAGGGAFECHGAAHLWEMNSPGNTLISNRTFEIRNTQYELASGNSGNGSAACFVSDCENRPCFSTMIGPTCKMPDSISNDTVAGTSFCYSNLSPEDANHHTYYLARMTCLGFPSGLGGAALGIRPFDNNDSAQSGAVAMILFQNTITRVFAAIRPSGQASGDVGTVVGRCNLIEGLWPDPVSDEALVVWGIGASPGQVVLDFDASNVYDVDEATDSFQLRAGRWEKAQDVPASFDSGGYMMNPDWFGSTPGSSEGPLESGGDGVDGNVLTPGAACGAGKLCENACNQTLFVPLHEHAFVPSAATVANTKITGFTMGTHYTDVGAGRATTAVPATHGRLLGALAIALLGLGIAGSRSLRG